MRYEIIVIGASFGGAHALRTILSQLPSSHTVPMVVVQHRDKSSNSMLSTFLQRQTHLIIEEAEDKTPVTPGHIYVAPADYHLLIEDKRLCLSTEGPVNYARPSIDVSFDSAARCYGERLIGVVLTGASKDGAEGAAQIERRGGLVIIQDPKTAEMATLPTAAIEAVSNAKVMGLSEIGTYLREIACITAQNNVMPRIPLAKDKAAPPETTPESVLILLAEDNSVNQKIANLQLKKLGLESITVTNGLAAVEEAKRGIYSLILMDCQMPELDGFKATKAIRLAEKRTGRRIPIIGLTAQSLDGDRELCIAAGMDDYLSKPTSVETLAGMFKKYIVNFEESKTLESGDRKE